MLSYRRLMLYGLMALMPLLAFEVYSDVEIHQQRTKLLRAGAMQALQGVAAEQRRIFDDVRHLLTAAVALGAVDRSPPECAAAMARLGPGLPRHVVLEIARVDGGIWCSSDPASVGVQVGAVRSFQEALGSTEIVVGDYSEGLRSHRPIFPVRLRYHDAAGAVAGVVTAVVDIGWLDGYLASNMTDASTAFVIADRWGTVAMRAPEALGAVGQPLTAAYQPLRAAAQSGVDTVTDADGVVRVMAHLPPSTNPDGLFMAVGYDERAALAPLNRAMLVSVLTFLGVFALSVAGAWLVARRGLDVERRANEAARKTASVLERATDGVLEIGCDWRIVYLNGRARELLRAPADAVGRSALEVCLALQGSNIPERYRVAMAAAEPSEFEYQGPSTGLWYGVRVFPGADSAVIYFRDLTGQKTATQELRQERALLRAVIDRMPAGLFVVEKPGGRLILTNGTAQRLIGHSVERADSVDDYSKHCAVHADGTRYRPEEYPLARAVRDGAVVDQEEMRYIRGDGQLVTLSVSSAPVDDRSDAGGLAISVFHDITERTTMERALVESQDRLAQALDAAQAGTFDYDARTGTVVWSEQSYRLYGLDPAGPPATLDTWLGLMHPDDRPVVQDAVAATFAARQAASNLEYRIVLPDGTVRWIREVGRVTYGADGAPVRSVGLDIDITASKQAEEELRQAKLEAERANTAKSKFLAAASHDLRQPMQSMFLFAGALEASVRDAPGRECLDMLSSSLNTLKGLFDSLLDVSRLDINVTCPKIEAFALHDLLDDLTAIYTAVAAAKGLSFSVTAPPGLLLRSDRTLLGRMVRNLIENAIRYTDQGAVTVECCRAGEAVHITVKDTGIGIPDDQIDLIFNEFHQLHNPERDKARGLGRGLSIVQRLSHFLDHPVCVRSTLGEGSVFQIEVAGATTAAPATPGGRAAAPFGHGKTLLMIDDDDSVLFGMRAMFRDWGHTTLTAGSRAQALEVVRTTGRPIDFILSDYRLRSGETGVQAIEAVRAAVGADVPGVILTGETTPECAADAARHGLVLRHKPLAPRQLIDLIEEQIGAVQAE